MMEIWVSVIIGFVIGAVYMTIETYIRRLK